MNHKDFRFDGLAEYTDEAIIAEIQRVAAVSSPHPMTERFFKSQANVGMSTVRRHFGSWRNALKVAGLAHLTNDARTVSDKMIVQRGKGLSDAQLLALLRKVAADLAKTTISVEEFNRNAPINAATLCRRFHGWGKALSLAGLSPAKVQKRYSDDECFENLLKVWTHYGRRPRLDEMPNPPSSISVRAYLNRWGTWRKTLKAFVARINADIGGETGEETRHRVEPVLDTPVYVPRKPDSEQHAIKLGLRYEVLRRDRFRCVICGRSPATTLGLELHVDHVMAFSAGGKTVPENLRSTCGDCNLGKGSKTE